MLVLVSQHYSKVIGPICSKLLESVKSNYKDDYMKIKKRQFSIFTEDFKNQMKAKNSIKNIVLVGIETHFCILQSTEDFISNGYQVYLVAYATSSQREYDRKMALERLKEAGVKLKTAESIVYELFQTSESETFKQVLNEVKKRNTDVMLD